jgi:GAF domain-containing protein
MLHPPKKRKLNGSESLGLLLLDNCGPEERLDQITQDAAALFNVPIAMINLVTSDHIMFKSCVGLLQGGHLNRSGSFCSHASRQEKPLSVPNATLDEMFKNNALVTGPLNIRSYVGKSLHAPDGTRIGTLCLLDTKPRTYSAKQLKILTNLAELADQQLHAILAHKSLSDNKMVAA